MTRAFFYDTLCGMVYRCMFAGLDIDGKAHWLVITPGEESKTLENVVIDEELGEDTRFLLIAMEGEQAQSEIVAKLLGKVMECPIDGLDADLAFSIRNMEKLGVNWDKNPVALEFRVFENTEQSRRKGKFSFWVENKNDICGILTDIDNFDDLHELFDWIRIYLRSLEVTARIPVITKDLRISDELKREVRKNELGMFNHILKEHDYLMNKEKD